FPVAAAGNRTGKSGDPADTNVCPTIARLKLPAQSPKLMKEMRYCESPYLYRRRRTREIVIGDPKNGGVIIGGDHPVVMQSMLTCDTMDTAESVKQTLELVAVGCQLVRITAPTVKDAANLKNIVEELRQRGC